MSDMPAVLYVQKGLSQTGPAGSTIEELFTNSTADKALTRNLGPGRVAGASVGVYKLDRVVSMKVSVVEQIVEQASPVVTPAPVATVVNQNT